MLKEEVTMADVQAALERIREQAGTRIDELRAEVRDLERTHASTRTRGGVGLPEKTLADFVAADEGFKMLQSGRIKDTRIQLPQNAIHGPRAALSTVGIPTVERSTGLALPAYRRLTIRDLLSVVETDAGSIEYLRETAFANAAAPVAEGALKPQTTLTLAPITAPVITIAHWLSATNQVLSDNQRLHLFLEGRLAYGVRLAEENQLLYGSGVGTSVLGLAVGATPYAAPFAYATPTKLDTLRLAIDQLEIANYEATGIVLHPNDMAEIELLKDSTGAYLRSDPQVSNVRTLWGKPAVVTTAMQAGKFLVGDFRTAATLYDREPPTLETGWTADDFIRNLVVFRMEERISLALQLPGALVGGPFVAP